MHFVTFAPCLLQTPPFLAMFAHPSAEHIFLYCFCFRATFFGACALSSLDMFLFLLDCFFPVAIFTTDLPRATAEVARVEVARRRVEASAEALTDESFFFFFASFSAAAAAAAASAFLSWLSL
jgi:hypothetical protein